MCAAIHLPSAPSATSLWFPCVKHCFPAPGLTVLRPAHLQELTYLMSLAHESSLEFTTGIRFISVKLIQHLQWLLPGKDLGPLLSSYLSAFLLPFIFPLVCITVHHSLLHIFSFVRCLSRFCLLIFCFNHLLSWPLLFIFSCVIVPLFTGFLTGTIWWLHLTSQPAIQETQHLLIQIYTDSVFITSYQSQILSLKQLL